MPDVQNVQELNSGALKINFELDILFKSIYTNDLIDPVKVKWFNKILQGNVTTNHVATVIMEGVCQIVSQCALHQGNSIQQKSLSGE